MNKIGRNDPCYCGSGLKYKYCCIYKNPKQRIVISSKKCEHCDSSLTVDLTNDFMNKMASMDMPLKNFCKDNGFYYFGMMSLQDNLDLTQKLVENKLLKDDVFKVYFNFATKEKCIKLLESACNDYNEFKLRKPILYDAFECHFDDKYTLSIPTFFFLLEGILRDLGGLSLNDKFKSTIEKETWDKRLLFGMRDNADYFNAYVNNLFKGSCVASDFNRNSILHGMNTGYYTKENSMMLLLTIIEIIIFLNYKNSTKEII
jgi:hypothetical protein